MNNEINSTEDTILNGSHSESNKNELSPNLELEKSMLGIHNNQSEVKQLIKNGYEANISDNLKIVLDTSIKLKAIKSKEIQFSKPILKHGDNSVFFRNTINVIQGQAGVHKSRLAEYICASFLKINNGNEDLLGYYRTDLDLPITVVYVDTERNLNEQLPFALQSIQVKAGFKIDEHPDNFKYISLMQIKRQERFSVLDEYLKFIKKCTDNLLFIVLDVSTDCIEDFNKSDRSMELIDLMNVAINEHDVVFLCVIHENPGSEKARGHFGTELKNKATTFMQVGFEKGAKNIDTDIIRVKYLKCRTTAKYDPFYIKYNEVANGLVLASKSDILEVIDSKKTKASNVEIIEYIKLNLGDGSVLTRRELLDLLCKEFKTTDRTIEERLKELLSSNIEIPNHNNVQCRLIKEASGKNVCYKLLPIPKDHI
ncbi:MAG: hypothetical protein JNL65_04935 [Saprospiraceae bacterium]|nr:hypothetical protein [Saprospiraceae bacterium]